MINIDLICQTDLKALVNIDALCFISNFCIRCEVQLSYFTKLLESTLHPSKRSPVDTQAYGTGKFLDRWTDERMDKRTNGWTDMLG